MLYLKNFSFLPKEREESFFMALKRTCYSTAYPFDIFPQRGLTRLEFEPVTILSGGNGSGKTTALNIMAQALEAKRTSPYNSSAFFEEYVNMCSFTLDPRAGEELNAEIITSDDVFDFIFNIRSLNDGIDERREELFTEWLKERSPDAKPLRVRSMDDYAELVQQNNVERPQQVDEPLPRRAAEIPRVDARQDDLLLPPGSDLPRLGHEVGDGHVAARTAGVVDRAVGTAVVAPVLHLEEGARAVAARKGREERRERIGFAAVHLRPALARQFNHSFK